MPMMATSADAPLAPSDARPGPLRRLFGGSRSEIISVRSSVLFFAFSGLTALTLVSVVVVYVTRNAATREATHDAQRVTELVGRGVIEPLLSDSLIARDPEALAEMDDAVRTRVLGSSIVRVKLWSEDGTVIYSDEPRLSGRQFPIGQHDREAFSASEAEAEISDLSAPENAYEREWDKLLEVYMPVRTPEGTPLLFEAYLPYSSIASNSDDIWRRFIPALIIGLVALEVVQLPLAWSLARRLRRGQVEREGLFRRAIDASDRERRLIAGELHDGAVQDLVGQSYRVSAIADQLQQRGEDEAATVLREVSTRARATVRELRSLIVELSPPDLRSAGLGAALADLTGPLKSRGIEVMVSVPLDLEIRDRTEQLLYRAAREALRNVVQHAAASTVSVMVWPVDHRVRLEVVDNGRGFTAAERERRRVEGHVGTDLLENLIQDAGGSFSLASSPGEGTRLTVDLPL